MDLPLVSSGYVVPFGIDADAASAIMNDADAAVEEFAAAFARKLKADIPPIAEFDAVEDPQGGRQPVGNLGLGAHVNKLVLYHNLHF